MTSECDIDPGERLDLSYVPTIEDHTEEDNDDNAISDDEKSDDEGSEGNVDKNHICNKGH